MYNKVVLIGNLVRDPESRKAGESTVTEFSVAVNNLTRKGKKNETTFVDVTTWNKVGENCQKYLSKGKRVLVEGELLQDSWEDKEGNKRSKLFVNSNTVQFLSPPTETDAGGSSAKTERSEPEGKTGSSEVKGGDFDEDVPF